MPYQEHFSKHILLYFNTLSTYSGKFVVHSILCILNFDCLPIAYIEPFWWIIKWMKLKIRISKLKIANSQIRSSNFENLVRKWNSKNWFLFLLLSISRSQLMTCHWLLVVIILVNTHLLHFASISRK